MTRRLGLALDGGSTTEGGPANIAEFGSLKPKAGFDALREMDADSHVADGTCYPAVFL